MRVHSVLLVLILLILMIAGYYFLGIGISMIILSFLLFTQATLFAIRIDYYERYFKYMNPVSYNNYKEKGQVFFQKLVKVNYFSLYALSIITFLNGLLQFNISRKVGYMLEVKYIIWMGVCGLFIFAVVFIIDRIASKKAKST